MNKRVVQSSRKNKSQKGGNQDIPLYTTTTNDWHNQGEVAPLAVDLNVGMNEYTFSRTTPDNKFVTSTGLTDDPKGVEMVGGKKKVAPKKKVVVTKKVVKSDKKVVAPKKKVVVKSDKKKVVPKKKVVKSDKKSPSVINKIVKGTKNLFEKIKKAATTKK